ncbi:hypothetical protein [Ketobacter sp.]|uniref:hypothetical protein n=1 Tax=Ketobacter sp. TaxID=2083498 RepID=UPI000F16A623|nr:hypothetical protein [Ketobacter sp.]RLT92798.1 MAG: hypothetical protein D9N14_20090 [Ketobacter sp.]
MNEQTLSKQTFSRQTLNKQPVGAPAISEQAISEQDRRRRRGLIAFQIVCYGYLLSMFLIQMYMYSTRDW